VVRLFGLERIVVYNNLIFGHEIDPVRNQGGPKLKNSKFFGFEKFQKNWN
jgi:hypothetical protein